MDAIELREMWLNHESVVGIPCKMKDGSIGLLIFGPTDAQVGRGDWLFGIQVPGEPDVRWLLPDRIVRLGNVLAENT